MEPVDISLPVALSILIALSTIAVGLRWYARLTINHVGLEDYFLTASLLCCWVWYVFHVFACKNGFGYPVEEVPEGPQEIYMRVSGISPGKEHD